MEPTTQPPRADDAPRWAAGPDTFRTIPDALGTTRVDLHRLAAHVIAPTRHTATGRFGLRWTPGGFGTPFFGASSSGEGRRIRVEGTTLIDQRGARADSVPITTLRTAAEFLQTTVDPSTAAEHDTPAVGDIDANLAVDLASSSLLGHWFGMAFTALELVRADPLSVEPSEAQLWPGHFDAAIEEGDDDHRASYGASPGDDAIDEPYLYVSVWWPDRLALPTGDAFWNATAFTGRVLRLSDFPDGDAAAVVAARFWTETREALSGSA